MAYWADASYRIPQLLSGFFDIVVVGTPTGSTITIYRENSAVGEQGTAPAFVGV